MTRNERSATIERRTEELFRERYDANFRRVDRWFMYLMIGQWLFAIGLAIWLSPYGWAGKVRSTHVHVYAAVFLGGLISSLPVALALVRPGATLTRYVIAISQMLWSALLIHLSGGRIETHFHVFGSLAFLAFYRDWRVLVPATAVVVADHLIRQMVWPESVYGTLTPESWRFLEHGFWVAFEDVFLVLACVTGVKEMRAIAAQQARIEMADKVEQELAIANRIQTSILPSKLDVDGLEIAAIMAPATEVGGDYYDVLPTDGGCWIGIGDVAGHGLSAGLVMLQTQSAVGALVAQNPAATPHDVLVGVNKVLYENIRHRLRHDEHMTISLVRYERDGRIVFAGAHEEIIVWRAATRTCEILKTPGTWLGMSNDIAAVTIDTTCRLAFGDVMVLYTDGVTEAMNASREQFGMERLRAELERVADSPVEAIRDHLFETVRAWTNVQVDDVTLLVSRYRGIAEQAAA
jgi:serine phosphatase RsbU (regulator of sigma subunit)